MQIPTFLPSDLEDKPPCTVERLRSLIDIDLNTGKIYPLQDIVLVEELPDSEEDILLTKPTLEEGLSPKDVLLEVFEADVASVVGTVDRKIIVKFEGSNYEMGQFVHYYFYGEWISVHVDLKNRLATPLRAIAPVQLLRGDIRDLEQAWLREIVEYNQENGLLYWFHNDLNGVFWNSHFPFEEANQVILGESYVRIEGKYYSSAELNVLYNDGDQASFHGFRDKNRLNLLIENLIVLGSEGCIDVSNSHQQKQVTESSDQATIVASSGLSEQTELEDISGWAGQFFNTGEDDCPNKIACFYCGDTSSITRDHVIPISTVGARNYDARDVVPCCSECNSLLGNKSITTVEDRASYLAERLAKRYKSVLASEAFSEDELEGLGANLKSLISANMNYKSYVGYRISHCFKVACSLYEPESVSHLRGVTTKAKQTAYLILSQFLSHAGSVKEFTEAQAEKYGDTPKLINQILNETLFPDVAITLKMDRRFPFEFSIRQIRNALIQQGLIG